LPGQTDDARLTFRYPHPESLAGDSQQNKINPCNCSLDLC